MTVLALAAVRAQVHGGQRADRAAETHQHLAAAGRRQRLGELGADRGPQGAQLARVRRLVAHEAPGRAHRAQRQAQHRDDLAGPHPAELQAGAAEVGHQPVAEVEAVEGGRHAQPRLVARAQHPHLDALAVTERRQQALAVARIAHGGGGHRHDPGAAAVGHVVREEPVHRPQRVVDRRPWQRAGRAGAQPGAGALLHQDTISGVRLHLGQQEPDGVGAKIDHGQQLSLPPRSAALPSHQVRLQQGCWRPRLAKSVSIRWTRPLDRG